MALVVWRVEVLAIPAGGKRDGCSNATGTEVVGEASRVVASAWRASEWCEVVSFETSMAYTTGLSGCVAEHLIPSKHAKSLGRRSDFRSRGRVVELRVNIENMKTHWCKCSDVADSIVWRDIVNRDPSRLIQPPIWELSHSFERAVPSLVIHSRRPIITKILTERATRASGIIGEIMFQWGHCRIKRISSDDLVDVRRSYHSGIDERVESFNYELRACEAEHSCFLCESSPHEGERCKCRPNHCDNDVSEIV